MGLDVGLEFLTGARRLRKWPVVPLSTMAVVAEGEGDRDGEGDGEVEGDGAVDGEGPGDVLTGSLERLIDCWLA